MTTTQAKPRRCRDGWTRAGTEGKLGAIYTHDVSGWVIRHCGHPTANWPYYGISPDAEHADEMLLTGGIGRGIGFRLLVEAQVAVEHVVAVGHVHVAKCHGRSGCRRVHPQDVAPHLICGFPRMPFMSEAAS